MLEEILNYAGTTVCYESPFRLAETLKILAALDPQRACTVAREITKKFETHVHGSSQMLAELFTKDKPKGEIVLMIAGIEG